LKSRRFVDLPDVSNNDPICCFRAVGAAAFGEIFTNPQETTDYYWFLYRNIQEVFAPRMPTIRPYFAEKSPATRPYSAEEN